MASPLILVVEEPLVRVQTDLTYRMTAKDQSGDIYF
jgi:hypothetical protein